jgi:N6-adenosine-specific RNA methylase IME4
MTRYEIEPGVFRADPFEGLPRGHFKAIYADPPWHFQSWAGGRLNGDPEERRCYTPSRAPDYPTMREDQIAALPVADLAADDCVLFMWGCWPVLPQTLRIIEAWGFTYKTCGFSWMKANIRQADIFRDDADVEMGLGYWTRANSEFCLLATRGKPKRQSGAVRQGIIEPRRQHSRKPDCVPARIEQLVEGPYLELFARIQRPGWTVWGNQTDKFTPAEAAA